jgi:hypothetical protein
VIVCHHLKVISRRTAVLGLAAAGGALFALVAIALAAASMVSHWHPPAHPTWYWQLQGKLRQHAVQIYDVDAFDTGAGTVAQLHRAHRHVICYIDVGTWENWRPDAKDFPSSVLGRPNGWPGERWLDIRAPIVRRLMARRFRQECQAKNFDALEPDNIDGYQNHTGFPITAPEQLAFNRWIAGQAHALGLAVFEKNDPSQAKALEPAFDGVLDEQCNQYHECAAFKPYLAAGKPVLNAEYKLATSQFCVQDRALGIMGARYNLALNGKRYQPCS